VVPGAEGIVLIFQELGNTPNRGLGFREVSAPYELVFMSSSQVWNTDEVLGFIAVLLLMDVTAIGIFALWRMYGRHRYIISHFHDTVSSFYSYMGMPNIKICIAASFMSVLQNLFFFLFTSYVDSRSC